MQGLLTALLPGEAVGAEAWADDATPELWPVEADAVRGAVATRVAEHATARRCARDALQQLGLPRGPIPTGAQREPCWPAGVVGSITHCEGYRAAVVAWRSATVASVGIDAEPDLRLPPGVLEVVTDVGERTEVERLGRQAPGVAWDRLLFCAKEAVYKAWFPVTRRWLGFEDARVQLRDHGFHATVGSGEVELEGRWARAGGVLVATLTLDDEQCRRLTATAGSPSQPARCPQVFPQAGDGITPV